MHMILHNPDAIPEQQGLTSTRQFQPVSPTALRHRISELTIVQEELKKRLHRQEQATRYAIGISVLSTVLAVTAIGICVWMRSADFRSGRPLVALPQTAPTYPIVVGMR